MGGELWLSAWLGGAGLGGAATVAELSMQLMSRAGRSVAVIRVDVPLVH